MSSTALPADRPRAAMPGTATPKTPESAPTGRVLIDRLLVIGEALILQTYCPDKRGAYQDKINELKLRRTVMG